MKSIIRTILSSLIILASCPLAFSQFHNSELTWKNVTIDGKKTVVYSIFQDSEGMIWIGSNRGLYFYDGIAAHHVASELLHDLHIRAIAEKDGRLYLGGSNGLLVYDRSTGIVSTGTELPKEITCLLMTDDTLWIGGLNGVFHLDVNTGATNDISHNIPHKSVFSMCQDSNGIVYAGTYTGLARWSDSSNSFVHILPDLEGYSPKGLFANCIMESPEGGSILVGGENGLYEYFPATEDWTAIYDFGGANIKCITKGQDNQLLVGSHNGYFELSKDNFRHCRHDSRQNLTIADNEIWCIYSDRESNIWAGHERGFSITNNSDSFKTIKLSSLIRSGEPIDIYAMLRDSQGDLWLGGTNGIIYISGNKTQWFRHSDKPKTLPHNRIRSITEDSEKHIWISTDGGLCRYNRKEQNFDIFHVTSKSGRHNSDWIYKLEETPDDFWIGSYLGGIHCINKTKFNVHGGLVTADFSLTADSHDPALEKPVLENDFINNIITDKEGNLWILLFRSNLITRYSPKDNIVEYYDVYAMSGEHPAHICMDHYGRVWCAYKGGAIVFADGLEPHVIRFPNTSGDETVLSLACVDSNIWVSTQSNVWEINCETFSATLLPIPQKAYTSIYDDPLTGKVYLGGTDEIIETSRKDIINKTNINSIKLVLNNTGNEAFKIVNLLNDSNGISIPYEGKVRLIVSTLNYSPERPQRYMYNLSDSDNTDDWVVLEEGGSTITFSDLKSGNYMLYIKTAGSSTAPVAIPLKVKGPWTLSWWAISLYIIFVLTIICFIIVDIHKRNIRKLHEEEKRKVLENIEQKLTFLSNISHDLKTPLSMIMGPVSIMKEKLKGTEHAANLQMVYDNAKQLSNMIHRTLELQQIENINKDFMILSTVKVVDFCRNVFESFKTNNPDKNFIFHASTSELLIEADAIKFESIITNLLSNACKYSGKGSTITCGIRRLDRFVEIIIADDGIGIEEQYQPLIFQRMFRAPSTSKIYEGTGLGLYLTKEYLEIMGGTIDLYSKQGQGTAFHITIPVSEKTTADLKSDIIQDSHKPKLLIVEDNCQLASFIENFLQPDYTIQKAENGRTGLAIASSFCPDILIIDEMMPIMTGLEMCRQLKQNPRLASIPIIMLTAKDDNATESESIRSGIDIFMSKPFEPVSLKERIRQLLNTRAIIKESLQIKAITETKPIDAESIPEKQLALIAKVIEENISDPDFNVGILSDKTEIPAKQLYRIIKKFIGITPSNYIRTVRLQKAAMLLSQHRFTIQEVCYMVGFTAPSYFTKCFQEQFGTKPSEYKSDDEIK